VTRTPPALVVGTRGSALARRQTARVIELLQDAWPGLECEERPIVTRGDRTQRSGEPLPEIGGKGLFTAELEQGLRDGELDLAVHSLKDLPTEDPPDVTIGAVCAREDVRDCLVSRDGLDLAELPEGAVIGTSSLRRAAQLRWMRPDLEIRSIRGNVETRIRKVREGEYDATVLAAAGVLRLGLEGDVTEWLSEDVMLPAPGQGALAVQCRGDDGRARELLAAIDDPLARAATTAERAFLRELGAGCTAPVAAHARAVSPLHVELVGVVVSPDGRRRLSQSAAGVPTEVGERLAREALEDGADRMLTGASGEGPLQGRLVVVTRPREQSAALAEALEHAGATVVVVPLIAIAPAVDARPLEVVARSIGRYDWVVFTSANAVAAVGALGVDLGSVRVAAVGPATADAIRRLGAGPAFVPERHASEDIAAGLGSIDGQRVLLPQGDLADGSLADELRARGAAVDAVVAYRTLEATPTRAGLARLGRADAVVLASGSAVRSLVRNVPDLTWEERVPVYIGPKTAEVGRAVGLPDGIVAEDATADGIIQALVSHFGGRA
jgi:hydroxymethylbilane synthase